MKELRLKKKEAFEGKLWVSEKNYNKINLNIINNILLIDNLYANFKNKKLFLIAFFLDLIIIIKIMEKKYNKYLQLLMIL